MRQLLQWAIRTIEIPVVVFHQQQFLKRTQHKAKLNWRAAAKFPTVSFNKSHWMPISSLSSHASSSFCPLSSADSIRWALLGILGFTCLALPVDSDNAHTRCDDSAATSGTEESKKTSSRDQMIDNYLASLMEDHRLVKLPYNMGTSNATLMHLFGVDRAIVEEAIATVESTIDGWNKEAGMLVGHPIVYDLKDPEGSANISSYQPHTSRKETIVTSTYLTHYPEFYVPWTLLEQIADILWEDERARLGIFPESIEKTFMVNILNVVSAILFDLLLSMNITMNDGAVRLRWSIDRAQYHKYYENLTKDPEAFRRLVEESLSQMDFEEISRQAQEAVHQQQKQPEEVQKDQDDALEAIYQFFRDKSLPHVSLDFVEVEIYEMAFKLMLILFYWFTLDAEARVLGRCITQRFVKPSTSASCAVKTNVLKETS